MRYPSFDEWYNNHEEEIREQLEEEGLPQQDIEDFDWLAEYESYISGLEDLAYDEWRDQQMMKGEELI